MFKKLVSNLPFSPSLVGQLGFYAQRLKKEEAIRRLGLIFTAFALVIQSFAVFSPPESANASTDSYMCPGVTRDSAGADKIKACYNNNTRHYKDVLNFFGISKSELWGALDAGGSWRYTTTYGDWYTFGHESRSIDVKNYSDQVPGDLYARKWKNSITTRQWGWRGNSGETSFIVLADCGNLALQRLLSPSAKCISLSASKTDITVGESITLTARASTDDGAVISGYNFKQEGPELASSSVSTSSLSSNWARTLSKAGTYRFTVSINTTNNRDNITASSCVAEVKVAEKPQAFCEQLTVNPTSGVIGTTFKINAKASAINGARITKYNFTANGPKTYSWSVATGTATSTWSLAPDAAGTYSTSVSVDTTDGVKTAPACNTSFVVKASPSAECKLLAVEQISRTKFKLNATAEAINGATVTGYSYIVKDSTGNIVKQSGKIAGASWTVEMPENNSVSNSVNYTAVLTVHTSLGDRTSGDCSKTISIPPKNKCEFNPGLPIDDPNCKPKCAYNDQLFSDDPNCYEHCTVVGKETLRKDDPNCYENCTVPGKESMKKDDPNCYEHCTVVGKETLRKDDPNCYENCTVPGKESMKKDDPNCKSDCDSDPKMAGCAPEIEIIKTANNKSQGDKDATTVTANGGDVITYNITLVNRGHTPGKITLEDMIIDTLEYATVTDAGGASYNDDSRTLSWGEVTVEPGATVTRAFAVTVKNPVPSMAENHGSPDSYDCIMSNVIRKDGEGIVSIPVNCPAVKTIIEQTIVKQLPATGPGENIMFGGIVAAVVVFFYARSRQLGKEVRLVRREFNAGTL